MPRILLLEPNPEVRAPLTRQLTRLGHDIVEDATDAEVLIVEPGEPAMLEAVRAERRRRPALPVVCASIYPRSTETDVPRASAYLVKPIRLEDLASALTATLRHTARGESARR